MKEKSNINGTQIMGIINLTPDSFYGMSRFQTEKEVVKKAIEMVDQGADIIDLGAMSSRPGAAQLSVEEELDRLGNCVALLNKEGIKVSVDTFRSEVAKVVLDQGANIINDIYGGRFDEYIMRTAAVYDATYIIMHMQKDPSTMQNQPNYENIVKEVLWFLRKQILHGQSVGLRNIWIDPGFGFGKTIKHNYQILKSLEVFKILECPILAGISRKSMIHKLLDIKPETALNGTSFLHAIALEKGAQILRVHDVKEAGECRELYHFLKNA